MEHLIMTIDIGLHKSGFCLFNKETGIPIEHGCISSGDTEGMCNDLFAIAKSRNIEELIIEITNRKDSGNVKLHRLIELHTQQVEFTVRCIPAAEWRHTLHFYSKRVEREEYKEMALDYIKEHFPEHYQDTMRDDEAEAICIAVASSKGLPDFITNKERRNEAARAKKNYYKHEEEEEEEVLYKQFFR